MGVGHPGRADLHPTRTRPPCRRGRRRPPRVAAGDAPPARRDGFRSRPSCDHGEAARADARGRRGDRGGGADTRPGRDGQPELPLPPPVARARGARQGRHAGRAPGDPRRVPPRPAEPLDLSPRLARPDGTSAAPGHVDPPRRPRPVDNRSRGGRGRRPRLAGRRQPVPARPERRRAAHPRGRDDGLVLRHLERGAGPRDVVERRLGARRREGEGDLDRGGQRPAPGNGRARAVRRRPAESCSRRRCRRSTASASCTRPGARSATAACRSAPPPTTCTRSRPCWRSPARRNCGRRWRSTA